MIELNKIYNEDCLEGMRKLDDNSIDLTVTSPPYDNLRSYNGNNEHWSENVWKSVIEELYRVTAEGGFVVWVVGDATIKGSETGTSFRQALYAKDAGFNIHDTMIYEKIGMSFPDSNRYYQMFEYMFIFSKGAPKTFNAIKDKKNVSAGRTVSGKDRNKDGTFKERSGFGSVRKDFGTRFNVWKIPNQKRGTGHPAPFPIELAQDHIVSWSEEKDVVFDPFMGSGTTAIAAMNTGRNFIGFEIDETYYSLANKRIEDRLQEVGE